MSHRPPLADQISLFRFRVQDRSFDDVTIQILKSILVSKDVESMIGVGSALKQFMRDECLSIFREIEDESVEIKLLCTDFLVRAFAIIGDVESCLALRYEALVMRAQKATIIPKVQVTNKEWLALIEDLLESGFHSIANQACEKALMFSEVMNNEPQLKMDDSYNDERNIKQIKRLKDAILTTISSQSVQAQAAAYLKQKPIAQPNMTMATEAQRSGSSLFKSGIKKHNLRRLHYSRSLQESPR